VAAFFDGVVKRAMQAGLEERGVTPHTAMRGGEVGSADRRASVEVRKRTRPRQAEAGYSISRRCRKKIEEAFGWIKTVAGLARTKLVGRWKTLQQMQSAAAAYNPVRMRKLAA
jgi:hypothetical protein